MPDNNSCMGGRSTSYDDLRVVSSKPSLFSCFKVDCIFQFPSISSQLTKQNTKYKNKSHFPLCKNKFLGICRSSILSAPVRSLMNVHVVENSNTCSWNSLGTWAVFRNTHQQFVIVLH